MRTLAFEAADLAKLRYAVSPVHELVWSTVVLRKPGRWLHRSWREESLARLRRDRDAPGSSGRELPDGDFGLLRAMTAGTAYAPDFLTPVPRVPRPDLDAELDRVARTEPKRAVREVRLIHPDRPLSGPLRDFAEDPIAGLHRLTGQLRGYFDRCLAGHWPALRDLAEADIDHRGRQAAAEGPTSMLADLHPGIGWDGARLRVGRRGSADTRFGAGLVLVPCCFAWPGLHVTADPGPGTAIAYPPRGIGLLWTDSRPPGPGPAAALLGGTRAAVLAAITTGRSTAELARSLKLAPSTASHHLTVLRESGLATAHRAGRVVRYLRTPLGDQLLGR